MCGIISMDTHIIYIGLGSNLGNGRHNLDAAIERLRAEVGEVLYASAYVESEPWGYVSSHRFTNAVAVLRTTHDPVTVLDITQRIEWQMGRRHKRRPGEGYSDRIIDLDILLYDDLHLVTERLVLPHPHIADRDFVRIPLEECRAAMQQIENDIKNNPTISQQ